MLKQINDVLNTHLLNRRLFEYFFRKFVDSVMAKHMDFSYAQFLLVWQQQDAHKLQMKPQPRAINFQLIFREYFATFASTAAVALFLIISTGSRKRHETILDELVLLVDVSIYISHSFFHFIYIINSEEMKNGA